MDEESTVNSITLDGFNKYKKMYSLLVEFRDGKNIYIGVPENIAKNFMVDVIKDMAFRDPNVLYTDMHIGGDK